MVLAMNCLLPLCARNRSATHYGRRNNPLLRALEITSVVTTCVIVFRAAVVEEFILSVDAIERIDSLGWIGFGQW